MLLLAMITQWHVSLPSLGIFNIRNCSLLTAWHGSLTYMLIHYHMSILSICLLVSVTVFSIFNLIMHIAHTLQAEILVPVVHWPQIIRYSMPYYVHYSSTWSHGQSYKQNTKLPVFFKKSLVNIFLNYLWLKTLFLHSDDLFTSFCISCLPEVTFDPHGKFLGIHFFVFYTAFS